jgi:hypothetical protein
LALAGWHLSGPTGLLFAQLLPLFWGILSFSHTHHVPMQELANCFPCMGGTYHTQAWGASFLHWRQSDLFYFTQDGVVTCEWPNNTYNIIFQLA